MQRSTASYKHFSEVGDLLNLPEKPKQFKVMHHACRPFQDECVPYATPESRRAFIDISKVSPDGARTKLERTRGIQWTKLQFPCNPFVVSVIANETTYFLPKGLAAEQAKLRMVLYPTPLTLHECSHVEVMLSTSNAFVGVSIGGLVTDRVPKAVNPRFHDQLKHFEWSTYWVDDDPDSGVARFMPCEAVQKMVDDLCTVGVADN